MTKTSSKDMLFLLHVFLGLVDTCTKQFQVWQSSGRDKRRQKHHRTGAGISTLPRLREGTGGTIYFWGTQF
jgi:hypothetical protein